MEIVWLDSVDSTNLYCERLDLSRVVPFTAFAARSQTAGIGQRGNRWLSQPGQNLTFSLVLKPSFLRADRQFALTQALSLAVTDFLGGFPLTQPLAVKWPNDIYVGLRKICGMLISNRLSGAAMAVSVCGIGLNVNQAVFPAELPNATSLALLTGRRFEPERLLPDLLAAIGQRYDQLLRGVDLTPDYHARLLHLGSPWRYRHEGREIVATITGTDPQGRILLTTADGHPLACAMKQIEFLPSL